MLICLSICKYMQLYVYVYICLNMYRYVQVGPSRHIRYIDVNCLYVAIFNVHIVTVKWVAYNAHI